VNGTTTESSPNANTSDTSAPKIFNTCYPNAQAVIPTAVATPDSLKAWWCDPSTEYAFLGFSYSLENCPSASTMATDFLRMRTDYQARYVRIYFDWCTWNNTNYVTDIINGVIAAKLGVYLSIWFGFDGGTEWQGEIVTYEALVTKNQQAPWVIRAIAMGSEPIGDGVLPNDQLAAQMTSMKTALAAFAIPISASDMVGALTSAPQVLAASDVLEPHLEPMYSSGQTTGDQAWPAVSGDLKTLNDLNTGKHIVAVQTGWASNSEEHGGASGVILSVSSEEGFFDLLDQHCSDFKSYNAGWLWHTYTDDGQVGFGMLDTGRQPKWTIKQPQLTC